jgi:hypothetical protein
MMGRRQALGDRSISTTSGSLHLDSRHSHGLEPVCEGQRRRLVREPISRISEETLRNGFLLDRIDSEETLVERRREMSSPGTTEMPVERRRSHGIGGAGNMRMF